MRRREAFSLPRSRKCIACRHAQRRTWKAGHVGIKRAGDFEFKKTREEDAQKKKLQEDSKEDLKKLQRRPEEAPKEDLKKQLQEDTKELSYFSTCCGEGASGHPLFWFW